MKKIIYPGLSLLLTVLLFGCAGVSGESSDRSYSNARSELGVSSALRFEDIPIPAGFAILRKDSFVFQNSQTRLGTLTYSGKADYERLVNFFKRNMAQNSWNLINSVEFGRVIMNFEKEGEGCIVTIEGRSGSKLLITLSVSPLSSKKGIPFEKDRNLK